MRVFILALFLPGCMVIHQPCTEGDEWNLDVLGVVIMNACKEREVKEDVTYK